MLSITLRFITQNHIIGQSVGRGDDMQQTFICPNCRTQNSTGQGFCIGCGMPLTISCPNCRTNMPPTSKFCTNCGMQFNQDIQQPVKEQKSKSGWAKFGKAMVIIGIICLVSIPIIFVAEILTSGEATITGFLIGKVLTAGLINLFAGISLMRRG